MSAVKSTTIPTVFVLGGGGNTGLFVVDGLLQSKNFNVIVLSRPESEGKPRIQALKQKGVEIRHGNLSKATVAELEKLLEGVDIVLSLINVTVLEEQKKVFQAAKDVGVQRVVPSEFAIPSPPERELQLVNQKKSIRTFIKELGIAYTIIDVGWWMEMILPYPPGDQGPIADLSHTFVGAGDVKTAVTCRADIGHFVARILADPRTLNSYVFCYVEEVTQIDIYRIAESVSGTNFSSVQKHLPVSVIVDAVAQAKEQAKTSPSGTQLNLGIIMQEYLNSLFVHGDNTLETAKGLGALDARALYPDFKPTTLKEYAVEFYKKRPEIEFEI